MGKDLFLLAVFFVTSILLFSFSAGRSSSISIRKIEENLSKVNEGLYVYRFETSNAEYRNFLEYLKAKGKKELYDKYSIDSLKWKENESFRTQYHNSKEYDNYPVVNITHEAALAYCNWLSAEYNNDPERKFKKVNFRLPTETEWNAFANGGLADKLYPWDSPSLRDKDGHLLCNFRSVGDQLISHNTTTGSYTIVNETQSGWNAGFVFTAPVKSFSPMGPYGLYNLSGNVAEMLEEDGIAKGGSYKSGGYDVRIQSRMEYQESSPEIGFRVLMEVVEE